MQRNFRYRLFIFLFTISGFTGLVYESIWSHYLKLFLGHAAYAQALVIAIFMGGLAAGSWYTGKNSEKYTNLLLMYGIVEGCIGIFGLFFHDIFTLIHGLSLDNIIPNLPNPSTVQLYKWLVCSMLILPQSFLLGMTFPLMSNALIRHTEFETGKTIALLYFSNSIGAAIGVLISGFVMLKAMGLPGTILTAGILNLLLALIIYFLSKKEQGLQVSQRTDKIPPLIPKLILTAAFITGAASFIYEISWIRMLSMVLGASTHSFEIMLSAFILGLALGGFWIRKRIVKMQDPILILGYIQILMGLFAVTTIPLYNFTFDLMSLLMSALARTETGYLVFTISSHLISLMVMLPTTFCAGMTLPILSFILIRKHYGEAAIGYVYSANTAGAILGVFFTLFIGLPSLGLKGSIMLGSALDISLGVLLLAYAFGKVLKKDVIATGFTAIVILILTLTAGELDPIRMASGVYRTGLAQISEDIKVLFYEDGKTASISVTKFPDDKIIIATNGKPDASIIMKEDADPAPDEITMVLAGALPFAYKADAEKIANIGMGSGLTSHVLLMSPKVSKVDTIEIEAEMVAGAKHFLPRVKNTYQDHRSHIHIEDAKTFFSLRQQRYDIIVSEPSNPWVSGTSSLFTDEFYTEIKKYLVEDGLLVQWLQIYEINTDLLMSVMKALAKNFPYYDFYATDNSNLLIIARMQETDLKEHSVIFQNQEMQAELTHVGINSEQDIHSRYLGNEQILGGSIALYGTQMNSDYFPILDLNAVKSRYLQQNSRDIVEYRTMPLPLLNFFIRELEHTHRTMVTDDRFHTFSHRAHMAQIILATINNDLDITQSNIQDKIAKDLFFLTNTTNNCQAKQYEQMWVSTFYRLILNTIAYLQTHEINQIISYLEPVCADGLSQNQRDWLQLYVALSQREVHIMELTAERLIHLSDLWSISENRFIFSTLILSKILNNKHTEALSLWDTNIATLYETEDIPFAVNLLYSLIIRPL